MKDVYIYFCCSKDKNCRIVYLVFTFPGARPPGEVCPPVKNPCIRRTGLKDTRSSSKVKYLQESFTNILSCNVFN